MCVCRAWSTVIKSNPKSSSTQSSGSAGQLQRILYGELTTLFEQHTGKTLTGAHCTYEHKKKPTGFSRYLIQAHGTTSYCRRWKRNRDGGLCCFGKVVQAKLPLAKTEGRCVIDADERIRSVGKDRVSHIAAPNPCCIGCFALVADDDTILAPPSPTSARSSARESSNSPIA